MNTVHVLIAAIQWGGIIAIIGIVFEFIKFAIKTGVRSNENILRIKHGYPTIDGALPMGYKFPAGEQEEEEHGKQDDLARALN
jgi:hypothetical protein